MAELADVNGDELDTEEEQDDVPYVEYDISISPSDNSLELLATQIDREDIIIPFYQRKFVWKIEQASRLIESFLMGLPVPQIFLYVNKDDQLEVIDGQQRLMSIKYFFDGYFGDEDARGRRHVFKLKGLAERSEYNGKTFDELNSRDQRKLRNSTLRAINIKQLKPSTNSDAVFHIFERLNTGGTQLRPQEIRNAVYRGPIVDALRTLNIEEQWQSILGLKKPDKNQKDVELVLRLFSLFEEWEQYEKPMLQYLNKKMAENKDFNSEKAERFQDRFTKAVNLINECLEKPFRPKRVLNAALLEGVMVAVLEDEAIGTEQLVRGYEILMSDEEFIETLTSRTTDTAVLKDRIGRAKKILLDA
tara:strand:+ start:373 stop:1455 length:1083 start_codon:yes stop_codon:yes gene_type:complete